MPHPPRSPAVRAALTIVVWLAATFTAAGCALAIYLGRDDGGGAPGALKNTPLENVALVVGALAALGVAALITYWLEGTRDDDR